MNTATWILLGELCLVVGALVIVGFVYEWRKKQRLVAALEMLLNNLQNAEAERKDALIGRLRNAYQIDAAKAEEMSDEIFRSERQFIQKVVKMLMSMESSTIAKFNEDVYALLSPYWELLPVDPVADSPVPENTVAIPEERSADKEENNAEYDLEITLDSPVEETQEIEPQTQNIEPDGDEKENANASKDQAEKISPRVQQTDPDKHSEIDLKGSAATDQSSIEQINDSAVDVKSEIETNEESRINDIEDSEGFDSFVANIVEDDYITSEIKEPANADETGDDVSDDAEQQRKTYNLDEIEVSDDPVQSASE